MTGSTHVGKRVSRQEGGDFCFGQPPKTGGEGPDIEGKHFFNVMRGTSLRWGEEISGDPQEGGQGFFTLAHSGVSVGWSSGGEIKNGAKKKALETGPWTRNNGPCGEAGEQEKD